MKAFYLTAVIAAGVAGVFSGCSTCCQVKKDAVLQAAWTAAPVLLDGKLSEAAWQTAPVYELQVGREVYSKLPVAMQPSVGRELREPGKCRLLWDDDTLYIGVDFTDSDVHAYGAEDQLNHFLLGDVLEVFIKPESDTYYWELYGTPTGRMTTFFIPGRGCLMSEILTREPIVINVAGQVQGTLNNWRDRDQSWSAEMAIPRRELEKYGAQFGPGSQWRIFLARYNYSRYLPSKELASFPQQAETPNFHIIEEYGRLEFLKP